MRLILFILFFPVILFAQSFTRPLLKVNSLQFRNNIYVFGFVQDKNALHFKLYKVSSDLVKIDSVSDKLGNEKVDNLLEISADTLHGYLNFYFQKANSKNLASLLRFDADLKPIAKADNFEANKINSLTTFENEIYTYKNSTYTIRTSEDSLGKQFFLTKYDVTGNQKPFEYKMAWQYPLEKRNINTTHVFYADSEVVFVYVTILSGEKKGQWVLKISAISGLIIKGMKLNAKGDERSYVFNAFYYDDVNDELFITGNIYTKQQVDPEAKNFSFINLNKQNTFFFVTIDKANEVASREEKTIPITFTTTSSPKGGAKPLPYFYHLKIKELKKTAKNEYSMYCNIYKSSGSQLLFLYETGFVVDVSLSEMGADIFPGKIYNNLGPFPNLVNTDPKDINGKIELQSITEFDKFLYRWPIADVEKHFAKDENKTTKWIIAKSDIKTAKNSFYRVNVGAKAIESKLLLETSKYNNPAVYKIKHDKLIVFSFNSETGIFNLYPLTW